ncbi:alpha-(1,6)-fucosyltransferase-like [Penaeus monodon]|uniref:alpha-(1,6)-fucosyltransferase-like n=1 Tax=Penaeus monodon TaxID=6687 RepID=UPI0018A73179|nr:alpha-(1,6)-fucosyltransferase-like [Penaeus monodon]
MVSRTPVMNLAFKQREHYSYKPIYQFSRTLLRLQRASNDSDVTGKEGRDFIFVDTNPPGGSATGPRLHENADMLFRQIETDVYYTKQYILWQLRQLQSLISNKAAKEAVTVVTEDIKHHFRVTQYDIWRFRNESGLQAWQTKEVQKLSNLIQHRIHALQNPPNCNTAKKILCNYPVSLKSRGMASQFHHVTYCANAAYGTQRTLIIKTKELDRTGLALSNYFLPLSENCTTETETPKSLSKGLLCAFIMQMFET